MAEPLRFKMSRDPEDDEPVDVILEWKSNVGEDGEDKFTVYPRRVPGILIIRLGELHSYRVTPEVIADTMSPVMRIMRAAFADDWDRFYEMLADPDKNVDIETGLLPLLSAVVEIGQRPRPTLPSSP